ncbi:HNH endonuclease, partial [Hominenteromicrobium sp.]|uniref:HNH endonuclease n=1 Tax=Hominenteromicrobium sp. TaxID=3073581 RepID=UPI003AB85485
MFDYNSKKWKQLRKSILYRDWFRCRICARYGRMVAATEVHHIMHADEYPELAYDPKNLISLCKSCHNKQHPEKGGEKPYMSKK